MTDIARPLAARPAESLTTQVVSHLLREIVTGEIPAGQRLPQEGEFAAQVGVSRLTLREAVRTLQNIGVLRVERGRGTFVNPRREWSQLDPAVIDALIATGDGAEVLHHLTDLRRMLETGAAGLAAERRPDGALDRMSRALAEMVSASANRDIPGFAVADVAFHDAVLEAAGNPLVIAIYRPMHAALQRVREETTQQTIGTGQGHRVHKQIYEAIASGSSEAAVEAMNRHFDNTDRYLDEAIRRSAETSPAQHPHTRQR